MTTLPKSPMKKIDPERYYTLTDLLKEKLLPWLGADIRRYRRFVTLDLEGENILKGLVTGRGRARRYVFKGENIITLIDAVNEGKVTR